MDDKHGYRISFEDVSLAESGRRAAELREAILDSSPDVAAEVVKDDSTTQDLGTTLVLVLGTPAIIAISKGIADYLRKRGGTITITTKDGETIVATEVTSKDQARIAEALSKSY